MSKHIDAITANRMPTVVKNKHIILRIFISFYKEKSKNSQMHVTPLDIFSHSVTTKRHKHFMNRVIFIDERTEISVNRRNVNK